mmetsp:Transcript_41293/g.108408  ORF Transcript_41293/g.108408 Transcript_41293/m.108408 type:complete len:393 (-) Transcript_41293:1016-2194(-)
MEDLLLGVPTILPCGGLHRLQKRLEIQLLPHELPLDHPAQAVDTDLALPNPHHQLRLVCLIAENVGDHFHAESEPIPRTDLPRDLVGLLHAGQQLGEPPQKLLALGVTDALGHLLHVSAALVELRALILDHLPQGGVQVVRFRHLVRHLALLHVLGDYDTEAEGSADDEPVVVEHLLLGLLQGVPVEHHTGLDLRIRPDLIALLIEHRDVHHRIIDIRNTAHERLHPQTLHLHLAFLVRPERHILPLRQEVQQATVQRGILTEVHEVRSVLLHAICLFNLREGQPHVVKGVLAEVLHGFRFYHGLFVRLLELGSEGLTLLELLLQNVHVLATCCCARTTAAKHLLQFSDFRFQHIHGGSRRLLVLYSTSFNGLHRLCKAKRRHGLIITVSCR